MVPVERNPPAACADTTTEIQQRLASTRRQHRQTDERQAEEVRLRSTIDGLGRVSELEQLASRAVAAPVGEAALSG